MKITRIAAWFFALLLPAIAMHAVALTPVTLEGELRKWHKLSLTFDGPYASENDDPNPFLNYRLNVRFTHASSGKTYLVPGYFAADGNAENSSADAGNKWRVHFAADETGKWHWQASFRQNNWVAVSAKPDSGESAGFMDGQSGYFEIDRTDKKLPDFRAAGRLQYVNEPYLRFAETLEYFIKAGPDAPENLLSYSDFDGDFSTDGHKDNLVKTWAPHLKDWKPGDPYWKDGKGKALIGALNYLASKGMNSISFLTMNIMGDDQNVFPYINYDTHDRFDISKLAQWEVVFEHAQRLGLFLHFKTQEVENQGLLDGGGLGLNRKLYYRELIARFGHHLALNWNMAEESGEWVSNHPTPPQDTLQRLAMADYFYHHDPYQHHRVIHNGNDFKDLTGPDSYYTGVSLQTSRKDFGYVHSAVKRLRDWPVANGRPWAIAVDEPGDAQDSLLPDSEDPEHNLARMNGLWGALTAGAWGTEWYFGYAHAHSDLTAQDWRSRDLFWNQAHHALAFFKTAGVPYQLAQSADSLLSGKGFKPGEDGYALALDPDFYIIYIKNAANPVTLSFKQLPATYSVQWFDPRNGGAFQKGTVPEVSITSSGQQAWMRDSVELGLPPKDRSKDWVVLVKRNK